MPRLKNWALCPTIVMAALCLGGSTPGGEPGLAPAPLPGPLSTPRGAATMPSTDQMPPSGAGAADGSSAATDTSASNPSFGESAAGAGVGASVSVSPGYIDCAVPATMFRLRYDSAYNDPRPDRAEFFYGKCGCFGGAAPGPPLPETKVDYQDISGYLEVAFNHRLSVFANMPVRFLNPTVNDNATGLADMDFGFKFAFLADECRYLTFQWRTYAPTGDSERGLGTNHWSLEPSLLLQQKLTDCLQLYGEFRYWIPVEGTDFEGDVIRYGLGLSYLLVNDHSFKLAPIGEMVGWTVLSGQQLVAGAAASASGATIVNAKFGVRLGFGESDSPALLGRSDLYVGYGRSLTGDVWYKDLFRVEYRIGF